MNNSWENGDYYENEVDEEDYGKDDWIYEQIKDKEIMENVE